jgi:hypothetical protein
VWLTERPVQVSWVIRASIAAEQFTMRATILCAGLTAALLLCGCSGKEDRPPAPEAKPTSKPTEEDGKKTLEEVFAAAGVPVKVVRFSRTKWKDHLDLVPPAHDMAYEAEVEFQKECQMKEQQTVHWSPMQKPDLDGDYTITGMGEDPTRFRKGEQKTIRGRLVFRWKSGSWRQDNTIEAAN